MRRLSRPGQLPPPGKWVLVACRTSEHPLGEGEYIVHDGRYRAPYFDREDECKAAGLKMSMQGIISHQWYYSLSTSSAAMSLFPTVAFVHKAYKEPEKQVEEKPREGAGEDNKSALQENAHAPGVHLCGANQRPPAGSWVVVCQPSARDNATELRVFMRNNRIVYWDLEKDALEIAALKGDSRISDSVWSVHAADSSTVTTVLNFSALITSNQPQSRDVLAASPPPQPSLYGSSAIICPHCHSRSTVSTRLVTVKSGLSSGKVVGAILTAGLSAITPGVGLSRKQKLTRAICSACGSTWVF